MLRSLLIASMALSLGAGAAEAAPALAPGKPAGVARAQAATPDPLLFVGLGAAVVGLGLYLASGTYKLPNQKPSTTTTGTGR